MFNDITPLEFYCHKILPLVYDDSLSYYEVLCKVQQKLNELIENNNELIRQWELYKNEIDKAFGEYKKQLQAQLDEMRQDISAFEELIRNEIDAFKATVDSKLAAQTEAINTFKTEVNGKIAEQNEAINSFKTEVNGKLSEQDTKIQTYYDNMVQTETQHKTEVLDIINQFKQSTDSEIAGQNTTIQSFMEEMRAEEAQHKTDVQAILADFERKLNKAISDYNQIAADLPNLINQQVNQWFTQNMDTLIDTVSRNIKYPDPLVQMCDEKIYAQIRKADVNTHWANNTYTAHAMAVVDVNSEVLGIGNVQSGTKIKTMFTLSHVDFNGQKRSIAMYGFDEKHNYTGFKKVISVPNDVEVMFADSQCVYYVANGKTLYKIAISAIVAAENAAEVEATSIIELSVTPDAGCITEKGELYFFSAASSVESSITYYSAMPSSELVSPIERIMTYNHFWDAGHDNPLMFMYTDTDNIYIGGKMHIDGLCNRIDVYRRKDMSDNGSQYLPIANLECKGGACYNNKEVYFLHQSGDHGLIFSGTNRVTTADYDFVRGNLVQKNNVRTFTNTDSFTDIHCNNDYTGFFVDGTSGRPYPHLRDAIASYAYINEPNITFYIHSDMNQDETPMVIDGFPNGLSIFGGDGNRRKIPRIMIKNSSYVKLNCLDICGYDWFSERQFYNKPGVVNFENCSYAELTNCKIEMSEFYEVSVINTPLHILSGCEITEIGKTATFYCDSTGAIYFDSAITLPEGASIESPHANMLPADIKTRISMASKPLSETIPDISGCNIKDVKRDGKYKYVIDTTPSTTSNLPNVLTDTVLLTVKNLGSDMVEYETVGMNSTYNNGSWCGYMSGNTLTWRPKHGYSVGVNLSGTTGTLSVLYTGTGLAYIHGTFTVSDTITSGTSLYTFGGTNVFNVGVGENPVEVSDGSGTVMHGLNIKNNVITTTRDFTAGTYTASGLFAVTYKTI